MWCWFEKSRQIHLNLFFSLTSGSMKYGIDGLDELYHEIVNNGSHDSCCVLILVANDVDSICGCKIFTVLLYNI